jgi:hypothetical protein
MHLISAWSVIVASITIVGAVMKRKALPPPFESFEEKTERLTTESIRS